MGVHPEKNKLSYFNAKNILFRSVDRIVKDHLNDPCRRCKFPHFYDSTNCRLKNVYLKNDELFVKMD